MPGSPSFEAAAEVLERETYFDRLAARGTIRLALRHAGLDPRAVTPEELGRIVTSRLPDELQCRGVEDAAAVCASIAARLARLEQSSPSGEVKSLFSSEALGRPRRVGVEEDLP